MLQRAFREWRLLVLIFVLGMGPASTSACGDGSPTAANGCCKVCKTGKACGDTCINSTDTCSKGKGCACNG